MKIWSNSILYILFLIMNVQCSQSSNQSGAIIRAAKTTDQLLTQQGAGQFADMQRIINLYGPFAKRSQADISKNIKSISTTAVLSDVAYLLEGFFAQCGILLGLPLLAGIDTTAQQVLNPSLFFDGGVVQSQVSQTKTSGAPELDIAAPPPVGSASAVPVTPVGTTLPQICAKLFHASRYIRLLTEGIGSSSTKSFTVKPADLCAGVIVINNGWVCSLTMPSVNSNLVQQKGSLFCIPAAISGQDINGNILKFVKNRTVDFIPFSEGADQWTLFNNARAMKLVVTDDVGSAAFVTSQLGNGANSITLQIAQNGAVALNDAQGNSLAQVGLTPAVTNFFNTLGGPWAVMIEMNNQDFKEGDFFPTFEIKGLVQLNFSDFPLQFQAAQSQKIGSSFSTQGIFTAPTQLLQEIQFLSRYTQATIQNNFTYGNCKDYTVNVSLPMFKKNDLYVDPLNAGYSKVHGALLYDWQTGKYSMNDALQGITNIISLLFFKRDNMTPEYIMHRLKQDPNVLLT